MSCGFPQFSSGLQHLSAAYLLSFSGFSSQLFFNSLEAHKDPMGFIEEFSQDLRVNILILSDYMDKGATWRHVWFFWNKTEKKFNTYHHHPHERTHSKNSEYLITKASASLLLISLIKNDMNYHLSTREFLLFFLLIVPHSIWGLSSPTRARTCTPCRGSMGS